MVQLHRVFKHRTNQRNVRRLEFESLEQRRLLSATPELVKDINPGSGSSAFSAPSLTNVNGTLFFRANDGTNGYELWKSDGTTAGTVLVKDIRPGGDSAAFYPTN